MHHPTHISFLRVKRKNTQNTTYLGQTFSRVLSFVSTTPVRASFAAFPLRPRQLPLLNCVSGTSLPQRLQNEHSHFLSLQCIQPSHYPLLENFGPFQLDFRESSPFVSIKKSRKRGVEVLWPQVTLPLCLRFRIGWWPESLLPFIIERSSTAFTW